MVFVLCAVSENRIGMEVTHMVHVLALKRVEMLNCGNKKFIGMVNVKEIESLDGYFVLMPPILIN